MIPRDVTMTVGRTPLVQLGRMAAGLPGRILAKLEMRNPCGSVKDRLGLALIEDAERRGTLRPGMTIVEPTGGNTGIGLAYVAAIRGYRLVLTMPSTMSTERVALLRQLGAEVVLTRQEGILAGASSGAALHAALAVASREEFGGKTIVVLLADTGERYITTDLFQHE